MGQVVGGKVVGGQVAVVPFDHFNHVCVKGRIIFKLFFLFFVFVLIILIRGRHFYDENI
jgi:hypothetical protein